MPALQRESNWNEYNLNPLTRNYWRASLVPAAAVIPAPIAYIKVAAVKKLVVGFRGSFKRCGPCLFSLFFKKKKKGGFVLRLSALTLEWTL